VRNVRRGRVFLGQRLHGIFTHYKREEDNTMESGKLDEELARMRHIAGHIASNCLLLCNESFSATTEREGSEIARLVVDAPVQKGVKVLFVAHMFDVADGFYRQTLDTARFLCAQRGSEAPASSSSPKVSRSPPATARTPTGRSLKEHRHGCGSYRTSAAVSYEIGKQHVHDGERHCLSR
jgi:hypothetical protein